MQTFDFLFPKSQNTIMARLHVATSIISAITRMFTLTPTIAIGIVAQQINRIAETCINTLATINTFIIVDDNSAPRIPNALNGISSLIIG